MASTLDRIGRTAQKLARNPLGIIALFIVLIYGIAALALGTTSRYLASDERLPLVWFLVAFPFLVLLVFAWLVTRHHTKLYSPSDFRSDEGFIRVLSPAQQKLRLDEEAEAVTLTLAGPEIVQNAPKATVPPVDRSTVKSNIVLAESLVLRELEQEFRAAIRPQVWMQLTDSDVATFDGVIEGGLGTHRRLGVEIKFIQSPVSPARINEIIEQAARVSLDALRDFPLVLAIVTDNLSTAERASLLQAASELVGNSGFNIEPRVYDFTELKRKYGINA